MNIITLRIYLILLLAGASALSAGAQRCKVTYYCRTTMTSVEAYVSDAVDIQPSFPGGETAMMKYINRERRYPRRAYEEGIEGRVLCGFIVNPDGDICNVEVIRGVEPSLDREAVRVIRNMPDWKAGSISDIAVPVYVILPIAFRR